ncbi:MAG: acetyl-CoA carboxylase biotin carboxyl carrier protein subunit [Candidatus Contendobacter sp.]|jgi:biotin carboxyl carrier protein|nr:acetyl-CoA carboxylase biotin carboxyl carrier protein subunit [Candidatus Contendobacter sp.]MCC8988802.1 acetyl-CoA carboxylase biotin carboxyl carrier protein subunit [Candidatus Contendobacter sp.]
MEKKFRITVEGKPYVVTVEDITADAQNIYQDTASAVLSATPAPVIAAPVAAAPVSAAPAASSPGAAGPGDEVAPLGGVVQTIHVSVGQIVNEGDKVVSLEAMKMVTHVVARRGGKVVSIAVKPGDPVDAGQTLLTIG